MRRLTGAGNRNAISGSLKASAARRGTSQLTSSTTSNGTIEQVSAYWTGAAAGSYTQLLNRWNEETTKLNQVLVTLEDALSGTEKDQAATEEQHQQTISGLGSMMSGA